MFSYLRPLILLAVLLGGPVRAEQPSDSEGSEAKRLFDKGMGALRSGRFAEARDLFRASLAVKRRPATAFNLAVTLRGTGEVLSSLRVIDALLAGEYGAVPDVRRGEARRYRAKVAAEVATLEVWATGAPRVVIRVNGHKRGAITSDRSLRLQIDPGQHLVAASAPRMRAEERKVTVGRAAKVSLRLRLWPRTAKPVTKVQRTPKRPLLKRPWFWIVTGAVVVAAGVATAVALSVDRDKDLVQDPVFGMTYTLGSR